LRGGKRGKRGKRGKEGKGMIYPAVVRNPNPPFFLFIAECVYMSSRGSLGGGRGRRLGKRRKKKRGEKKEEGGKQAIFRDGAFF